jgi:hypothetical protein
MRPSKICMHCTEIPNFSWQIYPTDQSVSSYSSNPSTPVSSPPPLTAGGPGGSSSGPGAWPPSGTTPGTGPTQHNHTHPHAATPTSPHYAPTPSSASVAAPDRTIHMVSWALLCVWTWYMVHGTWQGAYAVPFMECKMESCVCQSACPQLLWWILSKVYVWGEQWKLPVKLNFGVSFSLLLLPNWTPSNFSGWVCLLKNLSMTK